MSSSIVRLSFLSRVVVALLMAVIIQNTVEVSAHTLTISAQRLRGGKGVSVVFTPSSSAIGCTYDLLASFRQRALSVVRPVLSEVEGTEASLTRVALKLPSLDISSDSRKGKRLFFRGRLRCPTAVSDSEIVSIKPKLGSAGVGSKRYIRALKRQFNQGDVRLVRAFPNLSFSAPIDMQVAPGDSSTFYVAQQDGQIRAFSNNDGVASSKLFFDVSSLIGSASDERGLLGLTFHPQFSQNGYFYVNYTDTNDDTVIARFTRGQGIASKKTILEVDQPFSNHNGGQLLFGSDGFLYIALGDGGSGGDPLNNGQERTTLLGSILRVDVDTDAGVPYRIPSSNPFVANNSGFKEEIYAYGFRNPWRISFDPVTSRLFAGDVGQGQVEEIDLVLPGRNYGWNVMEGSRCFNPSSNCNRAGLELPIAEYLHPTGFAVIGGHVYRGNKVGALAGAFLYGDFATGIIFSLRIGASGSVTNGQLLKTDLSISAFGRDNSGEVYVVDYSSGGLFRFVSDD